MKRAVLLLVFALVLAGFGCEHPTPEQCKQACWKAGELAFWKKVEDKLAAETDPAEKEVIREEAEEEWKGIKAQAFNPELTRCQLTCEKDARPKNIECIEAAQTHDEVQKCLSM